MQPGTAPRHAPARSRAHRFGLVVVALLATASTSCSLRSTTAAGPGDLQVRSVTVDEPVNGSSAAVRMVIDNATETDDELRRVTTPAAGQATLHTSETSEAGIASMTDLDVVEVPAGRQTVFRSGGLHVMLEDLTAELAVGDEVELTLTFAEAGTRTVTAEVVPIGTSGSDAVDEGGSGDDHAGH